MSRMIILEIKNHCKDPVTWIIGLAVFGWAIFLFTYNSPLVIVNLSDLHQLMMFWAVLIGYRMGSSEIVSDSDEWMAPLPSYWKMARVKVAALGGIIGFCTIGFIAVILYSCRIHGIPIPVLFEFILAVFLYYGFGMVILGVIGLAVGESIPYIWGYIVALLIAFFMGQLGFQWIRDMLLIAFPDGSYQTILQVMNLGVAEPEYAYNALYGFEIESVYWIRRFFLLAIGLFIYQLIQRKKQPKQIWTRTFLGVAVLVVISGWFIQPQEKLMGVSQFEEGARFEDYAFYQDEKNRSQRPSRDAGWHWKSLDLAITVDHQFNVTGSGVLMSEERLNQLDLSLYHNFEVNDVQLDGKKINYQQRGDRLSLFVEGMIVPNENHQLSFQYGGDSSIFYFATSKAVYLPSYFNWIPQPFVADTMNESDGLVITQPNYARNQVEYHITVQGPNPYWISIPDGRGVSDHGVAYVAGQLEVSRIDEIDYVYTHFHQIDELRTYVQMREREINQVQRDLGLERTRLNQVVALPFYQEFIGGNASVDRVSQSILYTNDGMQIMEDNDLSFLFTAASVLADELGYMTQSAEMQALFMTSYESIRNGEVSRHLMDDQVAGFIANTDHGLEFLQEWLNGMSPYTEYTKQDLYSLLQEWETKDGNREN